MHYRLTRVNRLPVGDEGSMSCLVNFNEDGETIFKEGVRPEVGWRICVGSRYARFLQKQDWWQTNVITQILEESDNRVLFETKSGSIYEWKII
jgi:hypothetical protein